MHNDLCLYFSNQTLNLNTTPAAVEDKGAKVKEVQETHKLRYSLG